MEKFYRHTFRIIFSVIQSIMITKLEKEGLFQNFFWEFIFGHLFLSIFENQITFINRNYQKYILFLKELKEHFQNKSL